MSASHAGSSEPALHHDESFIRKYVFSVDHKVIGVQYALTALVFLFFGFCLMMIMRWQLAYQLEPIPFIGPLLYALKTSLVDETGMLLPEGYNSLGAMHGTIMVFLGVVPLAVGGFGNYVVPLQVGAKDMAFPRLNMASYWVFAVGGVIMLISFFVPGGAAKSGWTSYPPLANISDQAGPGFWGALLRGQTLWLFGMVLIITSSLLGSVNFIVTIIQLRVAGLHLFRMPIFVWAQLITAFLLLLAFPPLEAAGVLQLMDRLAGTSFFMPSGLVVDGTVTDVWSGGGNPLLWQHLFWFLAHPEVYVLILPAIGIVGEVLANNTRKPLWGYRTLVYALITLGFLSFIVWAHHMFMTGMGTKISLFFATTTMIISIPSVVVLTCYIITLWGASIRFTVPMLFALSFLPMFAIGGLTGLPLGLPASDIHLHDTYYVIGHFHYVVAPGTIMGLFAGIYYWFPKVSGRHLNSALGKIHFWLSFIFMNTVFMPMFFVGMHGVSRRLYDQETYQLAQDVQGLTNMSSWGAWMLGVAQLFFIVNFFWSIFSGRKVQSDNPWQATTLEWATPTPPPHGNFLTDPVVYREPYEYNVPGARGEFSPQFVKEA